MTRANPRCRNIGEREAGWMLRKCFGDFLRELARLRTRRLHNEHLTHLGEVLDERNEVLVEGCTFAISCPRAVALLPADERPDGFWKRAPVGVSFGTAEVD